MILLGIETSCDETAVAIVKDGKEILSNVLYSQIKEHSRFQGVVPEIAARKHLEKINPLLSLAMEEAAIQWNDLDAVAVTNRPGLIGSLLIGVSTAKSIAYVHNLPLIPVNHIQAHIYAPHMEQTIPFPHLALLVSGGHTLLYICHSFLDHELMGSTVDDAVGEAYDKVAKFLDLGYPGGPIIDKLAYQGDPNRLTLPEKIHFKDPNHRYAFSYSGLKTAIIYKVNNDREEGHIHSKEDICAAFQQTAIEILYKKTLMLVNDTGIREVVVSGGVASNSHLRKRFKETSDFEAYFASPKLCLDNGAMVAGLGYHLLKQGTKADSNLDAFSRIVQRGPKFNYDPGGLSA